MAASPQMWIDLVKDAKEIWTQNSMVGGADRAFTVRSLVHSSLKKVMLKKKQKKSNKELTEEEAAYQKKVEWLKDHGDSDKDEPPVESEMSEDST
jgi:hypothetical protein